MGADYQLVERTGPAWDAAVLALCQEEPAFRERLLVESRKRCCEIFQRRASPGTCACIAWPIRPRTRSSPASTGISPCWPRRPARRWAWPRTCCQTRASAAGRGRDDRCRGRRPDAWRRSWSRPSWGCSPRSGPMPAAQPPFADRRRGAGRHAADLAAGARKLVDSSDETQRAATDGEMGAREEGRPRQSRYRRRVANRCRICPTTLAIVDDEELHALIRAQFEGAGDGAELPRPSPTWPAVRNRNCRRRCDTAPPRSSSRWTSAMPRRDACWPPRCWADDVSFRAMPAMSWPARASRIPWAWHCRKTRSPAKATTWRPATDDPRYLTARATNICRLRAAGSAGRRLHELRASRMRASFIPPVAVPEQRFVWERVVAEPGAGTFSRDLQVLGEGPSDGGGRRFHIACPGCRRRARRFHFRAQEAREQTATTRWCNGRPGCCDPTPTCWPRTSIRCCARR